MGLSMSDKEVLPRHRGVRAQHAGSLGRRRVAGVGKLAPAAGAGELAALASEVRHLDMWSRAAASTPSPRAPTTSRGSCSARASRRSLTVVPGSVTLGGAEDLAAFTDGVDMHQEPSPRCGWGRLRSQAVARNVAVLSLG